MILKHHIATKNLKNESGRSMTEMLGVLAIIGVLSIGGIAGYSYGMDKYRANETINDIMLRAMDEYRANETINDIMLRAVDLLTQAIQGQEALTLSEWQDEETIYDIGSEDYTYDNLIVFDVGTTKPLPETVCKMVYDALKTQAFQIDVNAERADSHELCGNDNTMTFYFDYGSFSPDGCKNDSDCGDGRYCDTDIGFCFNGTAPEGTLGECTTTNECCPAGYDPYYKHGDDCTLSDGTEGMCYYGTCVAKGCTYDKNKCEGFGVYCASPNDSCEEAFPNGKTGTCVKADFSKLDVGGKTYYVSHRPMSWWDADAACKALGRDGLVEVDDLVSGWNGSSNGMHTKTALMEALVSELEEHYFIWTKELTNNSCFAYGVYLGGGGVDYGNRSLDHYRYAVCR